MKKFIGILLFIFLLSPLFGTIYYVDKTTGNDGDDGESEGNAWETINKVNISAFNPNDSILFKRGETWAETLTIPSSGTSGNQITFGAYSSGNKPLIDGGSARANCIDVAANDYITIENIKVQDATGINLDGNGTTTSLVLTNVDSDGAGAQSIWFDAGSLTISGGTTQGSTAHGIVIEGGTFVISGWTIDSCANGTLIRGASSGTIDDSEIVDCTGKGLVFDGTNVTVITNSSFHGMGEDGTRIYADAEATYTLCSFYDNKDDGVRCESIATFTRCISYNNGEEVNESSGDGWTAHGVGVLTLNYCIGYGNIKSGAFGTDTTEMTLYNCTFYNNNDEVGSNFGIANTGTGSMTIKNCITKGHDFEVYVDAGSIPGLTLVSDYNDFNDSGGTSFHYDGTDYNWADWKTQSGGDANSINSDPNMIDPANNNFRLLMASLCINAGTDVSFTIDYEGKGIRHAPDIGAHENQTNAVF